MRLSVSLRFSNESNDTVRRIVAALDNIKVTNNELPHITLFSTEAQDRNGVISVLRRLYHPYDERFATSCGIDVIGGNHLVINIRKTGFVKDIQINIFKMFKEKYKPDRKYYTPFQWHPHVTIGSLNPTNLHMPSIQEVRFECIQLVIFDVDTKTDVYKQNIARR